MRGAVAVVTGGSRGLGLLIARELGSRGAKVVIAARDPEELERAVCWLRERKVEVEAVRCDLENEAEQAELIRAARDRKGLVEVLVNNAGVIQVGPFEHQAKDDFVTAMNVHFWAPLGLIRRVLPDMRALGRGIVINISSIGGVVAVPHLLPYSASKFALTGLSEGLRAELGRHRISVTTVCPGLMRTGSARRALFKGQHRKEHTWFNVSASLPGLTKDAERAARQIVRAALRGRPFVIVGLPFRALAVLHGLFPGLTSRVLGAVNRFLPSPSADTATWAGGGETRSGSESGLAVPSFLTALGDRAARRYNEIR